MHFLIAFVAGFMIPMVVAVTAFAGDASGAKMGAASKKEPGIVIIDHTARTITKIMDRKTPGA